jgi:hypothetical protein
MAVPRPLDYSRGNLRLAVAERARPSRVQAVQMTADEHTAFPAAGSAQPTQADPVAHRAELKGAPGNAACHGAACMASTVAGEDRSGSLRRRCLDL